MCPYAESFWSAFSHIRTEHGQIRRISLSHIRTDMFTYDTFRRKSNRISCPRLRRVKVTKQTEFINYVYLQGSRVPYRTSMVQIFAKILDNFLLPTLSVPEKLKNSIFEIPIIPQILNINNQKTTSEVYQPGYHQTTYRMLFKNRSY